MTPAGSSPEGRKASFVIGPTSDRTGVYYDQKGRPMNGSAQVLNPEFSERAVAEARPPGARSGLKRRERGRLEQEAAG